MRKQTSVFFPATLPIAVNLNSLAWIADKSVLKNLPSEVQARLTEDIGLVPKRFDGFIEVGFVDYSQPKIYQLYTEFDQFLFGKHQGRVRQKIVYDLIW
jgi:hypothetical protein